MKQEITIEFQILKQVQDDMTSNDMFFIYATKH